MNNYRRKRRRCGKGLRNWRKNGRRPSDAVAGTRSAQAIADRLRSGTAVDRPGHPRRPGPATGRRGDAVRAVQPPRKGGEGGASNAFANGVSLIRESLEEVRELMTELRTVALKDEGVVAAIEEFVARIGGGKRRPKIEFVHDVRFSRLPAPLEKAILRIVREGVTSAMRRAKSKKIAVQLVEAGDRLQIEIQDWGVGIDAAAAGAGSSGWEGIQERAELFGGRALAESAARQRDEDFRGFAAGRAVKFRPGTARRTDDRGSLHPTRRVATLAA